MRGVVTQGEYKAAAEPWPLKIAHISRKWVLHTCADTRHEPDDFGGMHFLPRYKTQLSYKKALARRIRDIIINNVSRTVYLDTQRLAVMRHFEADYCRKQFNVLSIDCVTLNVYCIQFNQNTLDYSRIWEKWLGLRNILAKYLGEMDPNIMEIDQEYLRNHALRRMPEFKYEPRPRRRLRLEWWNSHPDLQQAMNSMARWWGSREAGQLSFDDLDIIQESWEEN